MVVFDYFDNLLDGFEFLIALGSILGLLGLIVGLIFIIWGGGRYKYKMAGVVIASFILLAICGFDTGIKYFRLFR